MTRDDELTALEAERTHLLAVIDRQSSSSTASVGLRILMTGVLIAVVALIIAGVIAGEISIMTLILSAALMGLTAVVLMRRVGQLVLSVLLSLLTLDAVALGPFESDGGSTETRRRLADCEAKISALKKLHNEDQTRS